MIVDLRATLWFFPVWVFHVISGVLCVLSWNRSVILCIVSDLFLFIAIVKALDPTSSQELDVGVIEAGEGIESYWLQIDLREERRNFRSGTCKV